MVAAALLASIGPIASTQAAYAVVPESAGCGGGYNPAPGGGLAFADSVHGWAVGSSGCGFSFGGVIVATSDGGKTWVSERVPIGVGSLSGVSFVSRFDGWAVGSSTGFASSGTGVILVTRNGGITWSKQTVPGGVSALDNVTFIDPLRGWVVGVDTTGKGTVLATLDGGASWIQESVPNGAAELRAVSFVNASDGWAVGFAGSCNSIPCLGGIVATVNGGATWISQAVPPGTQVLTGVSFVDASHGWATGGSGLLTTNNGGQTWAQETIQTGVGPANVMFLDALHGWVIGTTSTACAPRFCGVVLRTTDGGVNWTQALLPTAPSGATFSGRGIAFVSTSVGWVSFTPFLPGQGGGGAIAATSDGGVDWHNQNLPAVPTGLFDVAFPSSTQGWAVGESCPAFGGPPCTPAILATANGGSSWTPQSTPGRAELFSVAFPTSLAGWAVGGFAPGILATTNGGASWVSQHVPAGVGSLNDVVFADASTGWAVGSSCSGSTCTGVILGTTDGGGTWVSQPLPSDVSGVAAVNFISPITGWALGSGSCPIFGEACTPLVLSTTNGGGSWVETAFPFSNALLDDLMFVNASDGWAAGQSLTACPPCVGAAIYATTDGGTSWTAQTPPAGSNQGIIYGVDFVDPLHGWAVGTANGLFGGVVLVTSNGGTTWSSVSLPVGVVTDGVLYAVQFTDASRGWVVGTVDDNAVVLHTTDGGVTWTQENMTQVNLAGANLNGLTLNGGDLSGANLSGANFNGANLNGANLTGADLSGANLNQANLTSAGLANAVTTGANFNRVIWSNTTCPDRTNSDSDGGTCLGHL